MITKFFQQNRSDSMGALASGLCLVHCLATPFIFIAQTCSFTCCDTAPIWWSAVDFIFIGISFFAVYWSAKYSSKSWLISALWMSWIALSIVIINEKTELFYIPENVIYIPAIALIGLHLYNKKYCHCKEDHCCASGNST